jgi:hypothetical protein
LPNLAENGSLIYAVRQSHELSKKEVKKIEKYCMPMFSRQTPSTNRETFNK